MALEPLRGRAWKFGDNIDTDAVIPVRYCGTILREELGPHAMEGLLPGFASKISAGDMIVGGANFGCGSSREVAPLALLGAGVGAVVAASFGRIFFRNAINVGLPILESPEASAAISEGDYLEVDLAGGVILNASRGERYAIHPFPAEVRGIIAEGGMVPYVRKRLEALRRKSSP